MCAASLTTPCDTFANANACACARADCIVRAALAEKKPFCIVPCCVIRTRSPRINKEGREVTSFEDYAAYLRGLHPDIQQTFLPFMGKNLVLYKTSSN